jgi:hypothetical protein
MPIRQIVVLPVALALIAFAAPGTAVAESGTSDGATYTVTTKAVDLEGGWHATVGQLAGGEDAVASAFNDAAVASGKTMGGALGDDGVIRDDATFESKPVVSFRPTAISQVLTGIYYHHGAAHPMDYVTTVVIDSRTARPITLDELFTDRQAGLNRLSEQTKVIFPTTLGGTVPMGDEPGNAPLAKNFHNWIPTAAGMEIHFEDYQFAHGLPVITVPWSQLTDLLAPDMAVLAH